MNIHTYSLCLGAFAVKKLIAAKTPRLEEILYKLF